MKPEHLEESGMTDNDNKSKGVAMDTNKDVYILGGPIAGVALSNLSRRMSDEVYSVNPDDKGSDGEAGQNTGGEVRKQTPGDGTTADLKKDICHGESPYNRNPW